jgi:hypothetical protein
MKKAAMRAGRKVQSQKKPDGDIKEPPPEVDMSSIRAVSEYDELNPEPSVSVAESILEAGGDVEAAMRDFMS